MNTEIKGALFSCFDFFVSKPHPKLMFQHALPVSYA